jgi:hypothetical protein
MNGFPISEAAHIVNVIPPVDGNAGAPVTAQGFSLRGYAHATIIIQLGVTGGTPTSILLNASTAASAGTTTALPFSYYPQTVAGASKDTLGVRTSVAATGITTITANDNVFYVIEVDAAELPDGSPYLQLAVTMPASSNLVSAVAILSGARNAFVSSPTVTA